MLVCCLLFLLGGAGESRELVVLLLLLLVLRGEEVAEEIVFKEEVWEMVVEEDVLEVVGEEKVLEWEGPGSQKTSLASKATAQSQKQTIDPKNWAQSASKAFLRQELLKEDSIYWTLSPKDAYSSMPALFSPFKYENFVTNFRNLKKSIKGEIEAISFDDGAVKKEKEAFPPDGVDRRGNERFHIHPAKQLLIDDIKNGAGMTYFNLTLNEYMEFDPKYFRKAFNRQKQREKEEVGWQHRRNLRGARNNLQRVAEGV